MSELAKCTLNLVDWSTLFDISTPNTKQTIPRPIFTANICPGESIPSVKNANLFGAVELRVSKASRQEAHYPLPSVEAPTCSNSRARAVQLPEVGTDPALLEGCSSGISRRYARSLSAVCCVEVALSMVYESRGASSSLGESLTQHDKSLQGAKHSTKPRKYGLERFV